MHQVYYYIILLLLPFLINADKNDWYEMVTPYGKILMDDKGWAKPVKTVSEEATLFEDFDYYGNLYIRVMSGPWSGYYLAGDYDKGIGAYKKWGDASYFRWNGCNLQSLSFKTDGLSMTYGPSGYFYFYYVRPDYPLVCITKNYIYRAPPPKPACVATLVEGEWKYMFTIPGDVKRELKKGTSKKHLESKSSNWGVSVSAKSESSLEVKGVGGQKIEISAEYRRELTETYENEWESNSEETWTVEFKAEDRGKAVWQFIVNIADSCDHTEQTFINEYAITPRKIDLPCCLPGYANDAPSYTSCVSQGTLISNDKRCSIKARRRFFFEKDD